MRFDGLDIWSYRGRRCRPIYTTIGQLYAWAQSITAATQEGDPYHDALDLWEDMIDELAALFDGSQTYTDPITGATINLVKVIEDADDMQEYVFVDYNVRQVWWPVFDRSTPFTTDEGVQNRQMYAVLKHFCNRVHRYCMNKGLSVYKALGVLAIEYNPIADYWKKGVDLSASAPYVSLTNPSTGEEPTISGWNTDSAHENGYRTHSYHDDNNTPTTKSYTTSYDDASTGRLTGYQTTEGGSFKATEMANNGVVRKYHEEGNTGKSIQEMIEKELELDNQVGDILRNFLNNLMNEVCLSVIYSD